MSSVPPTRRLVAQPLLTPAECTAIVRGIEPSAWRPGTVHRPGAAADRRELRVRSCAAAAVPDAALVDRIAAAALMVNAQCFGFRLDGLVEGDPPAVLRYQPGDHFDWHPDVGALGTPSAGRKLAFTLQLADPSEYEGGDLELAVHALTGSPIGSVRAQGLLVVFPAFLVHRVTPLARGVRHAIVGWLHGPAFT